jgi:UDP-glucose 4-epimerase
VKVLVTGGAGYIGSHAVAQLLEAGHDVTVVDDLSTGHAWAVGKAKLVVGSAGDDKILDQVFAGNTFDAAIHFAASVVVPESVANPAKYFFNNTVNTLQFVRRLAQHGVKNLVFSSTAAVYGNSDKNPVDEAALLAPINPYGASKMMSERIIQDIAQATGINYVILRYFNVAGAHDNGKIGQATPQATHLIKAAAEAAAGKRKFIEIFGDDYNTPDGTCVRDYIHVCDLIDVHILAMDYLKQGGQSDIFNCGYGRGYSVRQVLDAMQKAAGSKLDIRMTGRRAGDPEQLIADSRKLQSTLRWHPQRNSLELIVRSALEWERTLDKQS